MKVIRVSGIVIIDNKIALTHRTNVKNNEYSEYYTLPGGRLEENEIKEDGLKREILEEININVEVGKLFLHIENYKFDEYVYMCKYISGEFGKGIGEEYTFDERYIDSGDYTPELIDISKIKDILLLPPETKEKLICEFNVNNIE